LDCGFDQALSPEIRTGVKRSAIVEELHSPKSPKGQQSSTIQLALPKPETVRSVTPELIPDRMASRIPGNQAMLNQNVTPEDSPFQRMGARVAPLAG